MAPKDRGEVPGCTGHDVRALVKCTCYPGDWAGLEGSDPVHGGGLGGEFPARTTVRVEFLMDVLVEVDAVVALEDARTALRLVRMTDGGHA